MAIACPAMAIQSREETIPTPDGGEMGAYLSLPEGGTGPGIVVLMEIFGVGPYIRRATERLAENGYVALAPDLYRRVEPGLVITDRTPAGVQEAMQAMQRLDMDGAVEDAATALDYLRTLPEVAGHPSGVLGFCLGGRLAYELAAVAEPDASVCYYGSGIADRIEAAAQIDCPTLFHFGAEDTFIPLEAAERVADLANEHPGWECHIQPDGGHAFDNHESEIFHRPEAAARAWEITRAFLERTLPS
jgi:carboxymethylenebutenolidase